MDGGILALDAIHGIENCSLNNSSQPAREEWIRAGVYVRLQKNLVQSVTSSACAVAAVAQPITRLIHNLILRFIKPRFSGENDTPF
jgi:hypothetical protein